ncbi:N-alpha-acetyltransferase 60 [Manis javanica]|nr:N-alpha-acetyltransferase 60 [Manis javanica]
MTEVVPSSALSEVSLRLLCHDDIDIVKHLCGDWFPIEYPDSWYRDITSNKRFFSLAATYRGAIVGMIVAEIKSRTKIHKEDGDILASNFSVDTQVAYILSLGVVKEFRKHGIGSLLLESLKDHISTTAQDHCKAIYLHVLTTNSTAIHFYENRDFKQHHYLPYYYSIPAARCYTGAGAECRGAHLVSDRLSQPSYQLWKCPPAPVPWSRLHMRAPAHGLQGCSKFTVVCAAAGGRSQAGASL